MVFVGEEEELGVEAAHAGCGEGALGLRVLNAEVALAVYAEDGGVPTVDKEVGRLGEDALHLSVGRAVPGSRAHVPVGEPHLFGFDVLLLGVVNAVVGDEALEALVVVAGQPVDAVTAEAGAHGTHAVAVGVGLAGQVVDGAEVVEHALAGVVARYLLKPLHAKTGQTAAVGGNDDVVVGGHYLEVPAITPELADGRLRAALAEEEHGILARGVEVRRIDDPAELLLAIGGGHPALLDLAEREVVVEVLVFVRQLVGSAVFHRNEIDLVGLRHAVALGHEVLAVGGE